MRRLIAPIAIALAVGTVLPVVLVDPFPGRELSPTRPHHDDQLAAAHAIMPAGDQIQHTVR